MWTRDLSVIKQKINLQGPSQPAGGAGGRVLDLHWYILKAISVMGMEALHRPQTLSNTRASKADESCARNARAMVKQAASEIFELTQTLREEGLVRFLPPVAVSFLLPAICSFLVEIKSTRKPLRDSLDRQLHECVRVLLRLQEIWPIADGACYLVGQMITASQIGRSSTPEMRSDQTDPQRQPRQDHDDIQHMTVGRHHEDISTFVNTTSAGITLLPLADVSYVPGNMEFNSSSMDDFGWTDEFSWTMPEFNLMDTFSPDIEGFYVDPAMTNFDCGDMFEANMLDFQPSDMTSHNGTHTDLSPQV
jgi:hypothetical protein